MTSLSHRFSNDLARNNVEKAYRFWSRIYDATCGLLFAPAHRAMAAAVNARGGDVLEVGVGTGLMFDLYGANTRVTGIDISPEMLAKAQERLLTGQYPQIAALQQADVHELACEDASFVSVTFPFVLTLLNNPEHALNEAERVLRPGGQIIIVSHFRSEGVIGRSVEKALAPLCSHIGLRPDFPLNRIMDWIKTTPQIHLEECRCVTAFGQFRLLRMKKHATETIN